MGGLFHRQTRSVGTLPLHVRKHPCFPQNRIKPNVSSLPNSFSTDRQTDEKGCPMPFSSDDRHTKGRRSLKAGTHTSTGTVHRRAGASVSYDLPMRLPFSALFRMRSDAFIGSVPSRPQSERYLHQSFLMSVQRSLCSLLMSFDRFRNTSVDAKAALSGYTSGLPTISGSSSVLASICGVA